MTEQEAFEINWRHFVVERGAPSYRVTFSIGGFDRIRCLYRGPDGARCGVGLLIPDSSYVSEMDDYPAEELVHEYGSIEGLSDLDVVFLHDLQQCHDGAAHDAWYSSPPQDFHVRIEVYLRDLARRYGFEVPA